MIAGQVGEAIAAIGGSIRLALSKGRINISPAAAGTIPVRDGNIDEGADEGNVQDDGDERGEGNAGKAAEKQQANEGVKHAGAHNALDGSHRGRDMQVVITQGGKEIGVDAEDQGGTEELDAADEPLQELEGEPGFGAHDCDC